MSRVGGVRICDFNTFPMVVKNKCRFYLRLAAVSCVCLMFYYFHFRPDYRSVIVEIKVGGEESQMVQMTEEVKKIIKSSTEFDHDYLVVKDPQGTYSVKTSSSN